MRKMLLWLLASFLVINGLVMLGWPEWWYHAVPTVRHTGPFNPHFVRDIGCAYLVCGGALVWLALDPIRGWAAALTGVAFLSAHAFVHPWDALAGRASLAHLASDFVGVFVVPALMLWLIWSRKSPAHS